MLLIIKKEYIGLSKSKKQVAFTVVEMLIWLLIASFMMILTFKLIKHNENNKIPIYAYYFYQNVQDASINVLETLSTQEMFKYKAKNEIINEVDVTTYCNIFANSINTYGKYDCTKTAFETADKDSIALNILKINKAESVKTANNTHLAFVKLIDEKSNQNHLFVYAAFGTPFNKGDFNKDIFEFEHIDNKIIPIGYLSSDVNSPLKFNVVTRDYMEAPIRNINKEPLTYCKAVKYTGDKFSKFCECLNENKEIVTEYDTVHKDCLTNTLGCKIKPVKPMSKF